MEETLYKIYKLIYQGEVIYVGYTKQTLIRRKNSDYSYIPLEIKKESSIELIEETNDKTREDYWILYYKELGCKLYNRIRGNLSEDEKIKSEKERSIKRSKSKEMIEYRSNYYNNNKDKIKERVSDYRQEHKDEIKEKKKKYYKEHRDEINEKRKDYFKEYGVKNREKKKLYMREYRKNKKELL